MIGWMLNVQKFYSYWLGNKYKVDTTTASNTFRNLARNDFVKCNIWRTMLGMNILKIHSRVDTLTEWCADRMVRSLIEVLDIPNLVDW